MTKVNLEDAESYLVRMSADYWLSADREFIQKWLHDRFAELRARNEAKANAEAVAEAGYFEKQRDAKARKKMASSHPGKT